MATTTTEETTLADFFERDYKPLALRGRRQRTFDLYGTTLRNFRLFLQREPTVADLDDTTVTRYLAWHRRRGRAAASVNKEHANLTAIWRFANRLGVLTTWPMVGRDPLPVREPVAWLEAEMQALFAAAGRETATVGKVPGADWWQALLLVAFDTAERIGAILALRWGDVDLKNGFALFQGENRKGGRQDKLSKISPEAVEALRKIRRSPGLVFAWDKTRTYLWDRLGIICERAGLPNDRRSKFHRVRKTTASHYHAAGGDATELLGHSSRKITQSYLDRRITGVPDPTTRIFRLKNANSA